MSDFEKSRWAKKEFSHLYAEHADIYTPERQNFIKILKSYYKHHLGESRDVQMLDLGCGDGIFIKELLKDFSFSAVLVDGSADMIELAKKKLADHKNLTFMAMKFEEIMETKPQLPPFDLVISSLAIHHLTRSEKKLLFKYIHSLLKSGSGFINMDVCLSPTTKIENWYMDIRKEKSAEMQAELGVEGYFDDFAERHRDPEHHKKLDKVSDQLTDLKEAGFTDIDCYFKMGMFAAYGGKKGVKK